MDQSQKIILTPFNFFEWKAEMEILLRAKGLYRVTMETKSEPNVATEKIKWHNRRDEAYGLMCLSISRDLLFHIDGLTSPNEVWEKLTEIFGKTDEMRGHQIENFCECNCSNTWVQFPHGIRAFIDRFLSFHIVIAGSTSLTGSILLTEGTISELCINLRRSS